LTMDERNEWPSDWTPDSRGVLFDSDRSGPLNIYKQALDQSSAEPLLGSPQQEPAATPRLSPDGAWIIYSSVAKGENWFKSPQLRRVPVSGGPSQPVLTAHNYRDHHCARAPATLCLVGEESDDKKQLAFIAFDPLQGRGREVARIAIDGLEHNWALSPDGSRIAVAPSGGNRIRVMSLGGGPARDVVSREWSSFDKGPDWAADGKGFYLSSTSPTSTTLLYMDLEGHATALWEQKTGGRGTWGVPSPDGRQLAILGYTMDSNVWMLENF
jgi:Tol biopolymer transport system component